MDSFAKPISTIEKNVSKIDDEIYTNRIDDMPAFLNQIDYARKDIASLVPLLNHKSDVLSAFKNHRSKFSFHKDLTEIHGMSGQSGDLELYISDVQDHLTANLSSLRQLESLLARSQETYLAQLSISTFSGRQRVHLFLKRMAVVTLILTLDNVLFGLFSTNVNANVPMYMENNLTRFWIVTGVSILLSVILLACARKYRMF